MYILVVASNTKKYDCLIIQTAQLHAQTQQNNIPQTDKQNMHEKLYTRGFARQN